MQILGSITSPFFTNIRFNVDTHRPLSIKMEFPLKQTEIALMLNDIQPPQPFYIGKNLERIRKKRGLTLDGLAEISSISRATISALENNPSNPKIDTIWSLASALDVEFSVLVGTNSDEWVTEKDGVAVRLIERQTKPRNIEAYVINIPPNIVHSANAHASGTKEHVVVLSGEITTGPEAEPTLLKAGQSVQFSADTAHSYAAGPDGCRSIVTVIYKDDSADGLPSHHEMHWPTRQSDWEIVDSLGKRAQAEVQNGRKYFRQTFKGDIPNHKRVKEKLKGSVSNRAISPAIRCFFSYGATPSILYLYRQPQMEHLGQHPLLLGNSLSQQCWELANLAVSPQREEFDRDTLRNFAQSPHSTIKAALAAEVLTRNGEFTVPAAVLGSARDNRRNMDGEKNRLFDARIDVDAYEAFELVHPAYARQTLALADELPIDPSIKVLDIGAGPGLPLQMLLELRPDIRVLAVDPSNVAIEHLKERFTNNDRIEIQAASIVDLDIPAIPFDCAISIGASHHLDTCDFLCAARAQLNTGAKFIVADEMTAPYASRDERCLKLIRHHLWYILDTLVELPTTANPNEQGIARLFADRLPQAMAFALDSKVSAAKRLVRDIFEQANDMALPLKISDRLAAFSRFHILELQALVAGLDYEVEQKTYPSRFMALSRASGFTVVKHNRIYATDGDSPLDGGTHLFVLKAV